MPAPAQVSGYHEWSCSFREQAAALPDDPIDGDTAQSVARVHWSPANMWWRASHHVFQASPWFPEFLSRHPFEIARKLHGWAEPPGKPSGHHAASEYSP